MEDDASRGKERDRDGIIRRDRGKKGGISRPSGSNEAGRDMRRPKAGQDATHKSELSPSR